MAKILGLGGVFFRCKDVESYRKWWADHMGVDVKDWGAFQWDADVKGFTMMSPFKSDSDYLKPSSERFMINLRVDDVRTLIEQARSGGATVIGEVEDTEFGIFGWFIDPEGISKEAKERLEKEVDDLGLKKDGVDIDVDDNGKVTVSGEAVSQEMKEKIILAVGNVEGVGEVEDAVQAKDGGAESQFHTVVSGDTLWKISKKYYGKGSRYP